MNKVGFNAVETCAYISELALELRKLADSAGASQLSTLLAHVAEKAEDLSHRQQPTPDAVPPRPRQD